MACACRFRLASEEKAGVEERALQQESQISRLQSQLASQSSALVDKGHSVSRLTQLGALANQHMNLRVGCDNSSAASKVKIQILTSCWFQCSPYCMLMKSKVYSMSCADLLNPLVRWHGSDATLVT